MSTQLKNKVYENMKNIIVISTIILGISFSNGFNGVSYFGYSDDGGFELTRTYLTYKKEISSELAFTFQTDVGQLDVIELPDDGLCCSDTKTQKTQFVAYLKKAQLDWKTSYGSCFWRFTTGFFCKI